MKLKFNKKDYFIKKIFIKRIVDIIISISALIIFSPMIFFIAMSIYMTMGNPVILKQRRPGINGKPFILYKLRTMSELKDNNGNLLPDEIRITTFGKFLRKISLDELPEFWNVLKGDMSIVGPRPLLMEYLERYTLEQFRRHEVKPGITGWAQINGRNAISWEEKFKLDVWYVDNWSIWLDFKIIIITILKVLRGEGISAKGHATMPEFKGSND